LAEICQTFRVKPPPVTVRFYSIDIEVAGNEDVYDQYVPGGSVPHLYFYVGSTQKSHYDSAPEPDVLEYIMAEHIDYASTSGAKRGAKKGMGWGALAGGLAGIGGAIAIGTQTSLQGNAMMGAILGTIVGGAAVGLGLGAAIGAIAGYATDDRDKGPKQQKRKKLQTKSRHGDNNDPEEREADLWSSHITGNGNGRPLESSTRGFMEERFAHDFSHVRVHRDGPVENVAPGMDAYAATRGSNIYIAPDSYAPETPFGRQILGHELAHVVQNESSAPHAGVSSLESEADQAAINVAEGRKTNVVHGSNQPVLGLSGRAKKTLKSAAVGTAVFGALGAGIGLAAASQMAKTPFGAAAGYGALIGGAAGLIGGLLYGFFSRRTEPAEAPEAELAIRKRFGAYLPGGVGPLNNALVKPVDQPDLCMWHRCRLGPEAKCGGLQGWTDTGPEPPNTVEKAEDEPKCSNGQKLEHATPQRPVIYYSRQKRDAGTVVHEGMHAYAHPSFPVQMRNGVNEGVTEYFTRQILSDLNIPEPEKTYDEELAEVKRMLPIMGEETLKRAYFQGDIAKLSTTVNQQLGACALTEWALAVQTLEFDRDKPKRIIEDKSKPSYCMGDESSSAAPVAAPPAEEKPV